MLVIIHGYGGSPAEMEPLRRHLGIADVAMPTLLNHGGRPPEGSGFDATFDDLVRQAEALAPGPISVFGYSLGGYFALALAKHFRGRVRAVATFGTQFRIDDQALTHLRGLLAPERLFGANGERRQAMEERIGGAYTPDRFERAAAMFERLHDDPPLTDADLRGLAMPALVVSGEMDPLASGRETRALAALLPNARLALLPGRAHPIGSVPVAAVAHELRRFLRDVDNGDFQPGPPVDLGERLVAEGLAKPSIRTTFGQAGQS